MEEIKYKNAVVRIHGSADHEKVKKATEVFMRSVIHNQAKNKMEVKTA